jgi:hypothetical protein
MADLINKLSLHEPPVEVVPATGIRPRVINIDGPLVAEGYKFGNRKRIQRGLPPALIKIFHQSISIENGETAVTLEIL